MKVKNNSTAPQGVQGVQGIIYIRPGAKWSGELTEAGAVLAARLPFLDLTDEPDPVPDPVPEPAKKPAKKRGRPQKPAE